MPTDLQDLLESAAAAPPTFDADAVVDRGLRQRRVRTWTRVGAAVVLLVIASAAIILSLPRPHIVDLTQRPPAPTWPLGLRYERENREGPDDTPRRMVGEFAANSWDDWLHVTGGGPDPFYVERWGPGGRHGGASVEVSTSDPFDLLTAASQARLTPIEPDEEAIPAMPSDLLHPGRFGQEPDPDEVTVTAEDLPELRKEVGQRLSLDPATLRAVRTEQELCMGECGVQRHTYVWIASLELPLQVEELDPDGSRFSLRVTHIAHGVAPPPNLLPAPAPMPPPMSSEPATEGFAFRQPYREFEIGRGTWAGATVLNVDDRPLQMPTRFLLERWSGDAWHPVTQLRAEHETRVARSLEPRRTRRVTVRLPDEVDPGWHRLRVATPGFPPTPIDQFHYTGDPNQ